MLQPNQPSVNAKNFFEKAQETFGYLFYRWKDESEYEDINDYKKPLEKIAKENNVVITKMNKRPFGCFFTTDGRAYQLIVKSRLYEYKRIK